MSALPTPGLASREALKNESTVQIGGWQMKVVASAMGEDLNAEVSPVFGRCPMYIIVDTETTQFEAVPNPAMSAPGGAGIQAAQFVVSRGVQAVLTGNVGPNAFNVLQAAGITIYPVSAGTVQQAVDAYKNGQLQPISAATSGMYGGMGGRGGMGRGMGRGGGRGMGRGMGMGAGVWGAPAPPPSTATKPPEEELSELKEMAHSLQEQLDQVLKRIGELEKKE
jgi:predicted Fe-Mo cluster-binding NifX family protein